jgi:hypothetical protein
MILTLFLGIAAGAFAPMAEPHIRRAMTHEMFKKITVQNDEFGTLTLLVVLIAIAAILAVSGIGNAAFPLLFGALFGMFAKRIIAMVTR